jgi:threonine-phosphate decarboxylase
MLTPRPSLLTDLPVDVHGGIDPAELERLGWSPDQVLDFSANLNPFGPSPTVRPALARVPLDRYPDRLCRNLRRTLAQRHHVPEDSILAGNGSAQLIWLVAIAYLRAGDNVAILGPTFGEYERASRRVGARVMVSSAIREQDFCPRFPFGRSFMEAVLDRRVRLAFLANPNNPTGQVLPLPDLFDLAEQARHTLFVLDEAYIDFVTRPAAIPETPLSASNLLRLRSLTKAHGLAGLRLGYALGASEVLAALRAVQPPWSVNALAQAAGLAALGDENHLRESLKRAAEAKAELIEQLRKEQFEPVPSATLFFLLPVGDAARTRSALLRRGILVRDCTSFGLPEYLRIQTRRPEENARLVSALVEVRDEIASQEDRAWG